ncbi:YciI family protein [Cylindrospermopsis raciborskii]|uniref:YciI family protein n=1 Tax=Cylindrospermopsis raciborskii TaxID=77022 RepID=UPI0038CF4903
MPWFVKIEAGLVDKATFDQYVPAHKEYVKALIDKGYKAKTGYWARKGGGMMLFEADSMEEAQAIVSADPLVINGCVNYQLHEWKIVLE